MALLIEARYPEPAAVFVGEGDPAPTAPAVGKVVRPKNGATFTYEELRGYVCGKVENGTFMADPEGMIEHVSLPDGRDLWNDEEGKLKGLPVNVEATVIYRDLWKSTSPWAAADTLVGNILICDPGESD